MGSLRAALSDARTVLALAALLLAPHALAACRGGPPEPPPAGLVHPTVAGAPVAPYAEADAARMAFTRRSGSLTATLEDAAWLRYTGAPEQVEAQHSAYFEYGYTTFQVELRAERFTQPTSEVFVLDDSGGRRLTASPIRWEGSPRLVDNRWFSRFSLSFPHVLTADVRWLRLSRQADGSAVEWTFPEGGGAPPAESR